MLQILIIATLLVAFGSAKKNAPFDGNFEDLPLIESANIVGAGFNARTGQSGLMKILDWTYNYNQTWQSPITHVVYKVPDQLMLADDSNTDVKVCLYLSESFDVYFHAYFSYNYFYGIIPLPGAFAAWVDAKELAYAKAQLANNGTFYGLSMFHTKYYSLDMAPAYMLQPSTILRLSIAGLPESYTDPADLQKYQEFVTSYGTHYVCFADMGGTMHSSTFISDSLAVSMGVSVTANQMLRLFAISFFDIFTGGFKTRGDISLDSWFVAAETSKSFYYGGNAELQSNATLLQWIASIPDAPAMLNRTLCPLSMLIQNDDTKRASLASFIETYVNAPV